MLKKPQPLERTGEVRWKTILYMHILLKSRGRHKRWTQKDPEYRRKNEIEIAATLYKEGKITLREAAAIMDAPIEKLLRSLVRGAYI